MIFCFENIAVLYCNLIFQCFFFPGMIIYLLEGFVQIGKPALFNMGIHNVDMYVYIFVLSWVLMYISVTSLDMCFRTFKALLLHAMFSLFFLFNFMFLP